MSERKSKINTRDLVQTALLITLVFIATKFINIKLPITSSGGLIHLGTPMLFIASIVFGKRKGAIAGGIGMFLFDLVSGWVIWAPFTLIIRGAMGYIVGYFAWRNGKFGKCTTQNIIGISLASIVMILGYYITEVILYGNFLTPLGSIPGDLIQIVFGVLIGIPLSKVLISKRFNLINNYR